MIKVGDKVHLTDKRASELSEHYDWICNIYGVITKINPPEIKVRFQVGSRILECDWLFSSFGLENEIGEVEL
jgi:hypothetical protein